MMIITCPRCSAQYHLDPATLGPGGRTVRCSNCANVWTQKPVMAPAAAGAPVATDPRAALERMLRASGAPADSPPQAPADPPRPAAATRNPDGPRARFPEPEVKAAPPPLAAPERTRAPEPAEPEPEPARTIATADEADPGTADEADPATAPEPDFMAALTADEARLAYIPPPPPRRKVPWATVGAVSGGVAVLLAAGLYLGRTFIVDALPGAEPLYAAVGVDVYPLGRGLDIRDIQARRGQVASGEAIVITGLVENVDSEPRPVPPVQVTLFDPDEEPLRHTVVTVTDQLLAAGASVEFSATVVDPPPLARRIKVTFVAPDAIAADTGPEAGTGHQAGPAHPATGQRDSGGH